MRRASVWLLLVIAGFLGLTATPAHADPTGRSGTTTLTEISLVNPVGAHGLTPGYRVVSRGRGACQDFSGVMQGRGYRCFTGNLIYDPCFPDGGVNATAVVCLVRPWGTRLTLIRLRHHVPRHQVRPVSYLHDPWALELATGQRCVNLGLTMHTRYRGRVDDYYCPGHDSLSVLHGLDRRTDPWTAAVLTTRGRGRHTTYAVHEVPLARAWYGQGDPGVVPRTLPFTGPGAPLPELGTLAGLCLVVGAALLLIARRSGPGGCTLPTSG